MKNLIKATLFAATLVVASTPSHAVVQIDFDDIDLGPTQPLAGSWSFLSAEYLPFGLQFTTGIDQVNGVNNGFTNAVPDRSGNNILGSVTEFSFTTTDALNQPAVTNYVSFRNLGIQPSTGSLSGYNLFIYDADDNLLGTDFVDQVALGDTRDSFTVEYTYENMHRFTFEQFGSGLTPIDDLVFNEVVAADTGDSGDNGSAIPAPALSALMAVGAYVALKKSFARN